MAYPVNSRTFTRVLDFEHVISEANGRISREQILVAPTTTVILPGTVMGIITSSGLYTPVATAASDGSQTAAAICGMRIPINTANTRTTAHVRDCEVNGKELVFVNATTQNQKDA